VAFIVAYKSTEVTYYGRNFDEIYFQRDETFQNKFPLKIICHTVYSIQLRHLYIYIAVMFNIKMCP